MAGLGFFAPLPLALMLPFMAGQSMLMGDAFGKSYQYGKRKISAMSNEEFNALTPADLAKDITADFTILIPELKLAMQQSTEFQKDIIIEMGEILKDLPDIVKQFIFGSPQPFGEDPTTPGGVTPPGTFPPTVNLFDWIGLVFGPGFIVALLKFLNIIKGPN